MENITYLQASTDLTGLAKRIQEMIAGEALRNNMLAWSETELSKVISQEDAYFALDGNKIIGFICLVTWTKYLEICAWIVHPDYRKKFVGSTLLHRLIALASRKYPGQTVIILPNEVSVKICSKTCFIKQPKDYFDAEIWQACKNCGELQDFPTCHCQPMIWRKELRDEG